MTPISSAALTAAATFALGATAFCAASPSSAPLVIKGACTSGGGASAAGCSRCEVTLRRSLALPDMEGSLIGACPSMAAGRYGLGMEVPVKVVPQTPGSDLAFFQVHASFAARARDRHGKEVDLLPEVAPASWSWWTSAGAAVDRDDVLDLEREMPVQVAFTLNDAQYFFPNQTQGVPHHDGRVLIDAGTVFRLTRLPTQASTVKPGHHPDLGDGTLAKIKPGHTTKAEVESLIGKPLRETKHGDEESPSNDVWDYRSLEATVHVEFDSKDVVAIIAKIPDQTRSAAARVASP